MQAIELFQSVVAIATNLDRIANSLEVIAMRAAPDEVAGTVTSSDSTETTKTKRTRRTKEQIAADEAAQQQPAPAVQPAAQAPAFPPAGAAGAAGVPQASNPVVPQSVPAAVPPANPPAGAVLGFHPGQLPDLTYAAMPVEGQFATLLTDFGPHANIAAVRNAVLEAAAQVNCHGQLTDPLNTQLPSAAYRGLTDQQRVHIYHALHNAIAASKQGL